MTSFTRTAIAKSAKCNRRVLGIEETSAKPKGILVFQPKERLVTRFQEKWRHEVWKTRSHSINMILYSSLQFVTRANLVLGRFLHNFLEIGAFSTTTTRLWPRERRVFEKRNYGGGHNLAHPITIFINTHDSTEEERDRKKTRKNWSLHRNTGCTCNWWVLTVATIPKYFHPKTCPPRPVQVRASRLAFCTSSCTRNWYRSDFIHFQVEESTKQTTRRIGIYIYMWYSKASINKPHPVCMSCCCSLAKKYTSESMMVKKKMTTACMYNVF